jgi:hypothetical protein
MKDGYIYETGTYQQLMEKNGHFRELSMSKDYKEKEEIEEEIQTKKVYILIFNYYF